ncbi:DUF2127 domain-containing protein [Isoptericola sp. b441]|uniref:DUF2127 domain-containing protein n=1 Tax=Actinotalea lenta TaxID=3064654 RepID=A0ABT9DA76_9CELL|nr:MULTISPECIES: DUF2127 domain-containing protein [unclassified Isoptericola]MDO8105852.1 DUF2127 domain-containing protein [Isoptericola sp. b441]MDO8122568.1 DUF2127 domain-containing protein [Isoptericola sp. b490]
MASRRHGDYWQHVLDLVFLIGVTFKAIDGLGEILIGIPLLFITPAGVTNAVHHLTARELAEDPHDLIANLLVHGVNHLAGSDLRLLGIYFLVHGIVKAAIVIAIIIGAIRVYPWAIGALTALTIFQIVELALHPTISVALLTVLDIIIIALTWREWREHRSLRDTARETWRWLRPAPARS